MIQPFWSSALHQKTYGKGISLQRKGYFTFRVSLERLDSEKKNSAVHKLGSVLSITFLKFLTIQQQAIQ
ncbi:hypothetical protein T4D_12692 [Trichinella pseudospiralis]|uniref:Uncharacterized protein n=1 Tax=Trichinella pseudospiralis TaxID=6337 RepID=A0A0V1FE80_TRIPS|nr:hypothetical protein T4D_12692 [Trichinella pseudospiralis]